MTVVDYLLIAIVCVSAIISIFRGFVKEALSLTSLIVAIWAAAQFGVQMGDLIGGSIESETLRGWLGRAVLLVGILFAGGIVSWLISALLDSTGLSGTNRAVGMIFGLARGIVLAGVFVLLLDFAGFSESSWWKESKLIPYAAPVAEFVSETAEDGIEYLDIDKDEMINSATEKAGEMLAP
jgi:membrane protein required for colicin V production